MKGIIRKVLRRFAMPLFRLRWRVMNRHNWTTMASHFDLSKVSVGRCTYGRLCVSFFGAPNEALEIGSFCSIASGVRFICGGNHYLESFSSFPFRAHFEGVAEASCRGPIVLEDDVWVGTNALILSGVRVGRGAVVGAGAVVSRDVPSYAIVCGVPARVVRYRFDELTRQELLQVDFNKIDKAFIRDHMHDMSSRLSDAFLQVLPRRGADAAGVGRSG